jgi:hypothetical protein
MRFSACLCGFGLLVVASSPAFSQDVRNYNCTSKQEDNSFGLLVGPHEYRIGTPGNWGMDLCTQDPGAGYTPACGFEGPKFIERVKGQIAFSLDTSTGEYFMAGDEMDADDSGTCRAQ